MATIVDGVRTPSFKPKCPNHGCELEACGFPLPKKGTGVCPVSKCSFDFEVEIDEAPDRMVKDKNGNMVKKVGWKISGND